MRTEKEIRAEIKRITDDERFHYPCATIIENVPLALIQLEMETRLSVLSWVIGEKIPLPKRK